MGDSAIKTIMKKIEEWFNPPQAKVIASQVRTQAGEVRRLAADLGRIKNDLDDCWQGKSKNAFMFFFNPMPKNLERYAGFLEMQANNIEREKGLIIKWIKKVL